MIHRLGGENLLFTVGHQKKIHFISPLNGSLATHHSKSFLENYVISRRQLKPVNIEHDACYGMKKNSKGLFVKQRITVRVFVAAVYLKTSRKPKGPGISIDIWLINKAIASLSINIYTEGGALAKTPLRIVVASSFM